MLPMGHRKNGVHPFHAIPVALWTLGFAFRGCAKQPSFLEQSFFFDWNTPGTGTPIPVTGQCDTLHITWERGTATGPNPTAPYFLQVYTSTFIVPFVIEAGSGTTFDWPVPFIPGTQYQMCMFDKNGVTGGCQGVYTVIPSSTTSCTNLTYPAGALDVQGTVDSGPLSQYGWIDQCTDISVLPKNGTPPYTLTVAPALHPPLNITSSSNDPMNWTVSLSWGFPFFISVADSQGNSWSQGPLHSGENGPTKCLDLDASGDSKKSTAAAPIIGSAIGGAVGGTLLGILGAFLYFRRRRFSSYRQPRQDSYLSEPPLGHYDPGTALSLDAQPLAASHARLEPSASSRSTDAYTIEPFTMPPHADSLSRAATLEAPISPYAPITQHTPTTPSVGPTSLTSSSEPAQTPGAREGPQVYVVHHDGGRPPVTVYTEHGALVTELPPQYVDNRQERPPLQQQRQPGTVPRKARRGQSDSEGGSRSQLP